MAEVLGSFLGWTFVPSLATRFAQSVFYGITVRVGASKPAPGSPTWVKHNRRIHITIVLAYLLYTIYDAYDGVRRAGDFYRVLGVPHDAEDKGIKSRFRRLAALHHPDKLGFDENNNATDTVFVHLKLAQDALLKPASRFAYDRFGPAILSWHHCVTISDYLSAGLISTGPGYLISGIFLAMLGMMGYLQWGRFWRYLAAASLALLEFYTATRPYFPPLLNHLNTLLTILSSEPPLLPFQFLILARKVNVAVFIAIAQLGPHFVRVDAPPPGGDGLPPEILAHLEQIARSNETEASRLLDLGLAPYGADPKSVRNLKDKIREWLVQNTIKADPLVREAVGEALKRGSAGD